MRALLFVGGLMLGFSFACLLGALYQQGRYDAIVCVDKHPTWEPSSCKNSK